MRIDVLGVGFDNLTLEQAVEKASRIKGGYVVTPNPEIVWLARQNNDLKLALQDASMVLPDGIGIIHGARILSRPLKERVPGIEFASAYIERLASENKKVFLLGAKPGVAELAAEKLRKAYKGIEICGTADGYFKDDAPIIAAINEAKPDFLLVCFGAPKQEIWMREHSGKVSAGLMAGLGGVLDVYAGVVERAPEAWCRAGFEWLYRLLKQPSRIGRMFKLPLFMFAVIGQRIRGR
ncbi:MAG: WecB/TagA/CpsF family glycosyltransferase [Clostridiales bacterium]|nr:WecB/TagA/CpsF family glycosyltransferase [Clostridiales bacterium]